MWPFCHRGCMPSGGFSFLVESPPPLPLSMRFDTAERSFGQFCHVFVEVGLTKLVPKLVCCLCQIFDASLPFQSHGRGGFFMRAPLPPVSQTFFFRVIHLLMFLCSQYFLFYAPLVRISQ